jgi:hypothetical protein
MVTSTMPLSTCSNGVQTTLLATDAREDAPCQRVRSALGLRNGQLPKVSLETLTQYYKHLSARLSFPFVAYYPESTNPQDEVDFNCMVLELLDPRKHLRDEFDGIFCRTRKGGLAVDLPLIDLEVPEYDPNFRLLEDYWYWLWNWR